MPLMSNFLPCEPLIIGLCAISRICLRAIGFTARPDSPDMVLRLLTSARPPIVTLLMVLMADTPSAPAKKTAIAGSVMWVTFGVIFGMTGMETLRFTYAV